MADDTEEQPIRRPPRQEISRRPVVVGLIGLAVVEAVAGGITWKVLSQGLHKIALAFAPPIPTPSSKFSGAIFTYIGHINAVNSVSWSTDGLFMVSGSEDHTVQVWNSRTGARVFNFIGHTAGVLCVGWQPDSRSVASGSRDGTLRDWATVQHGDHFAAGDQIFNYGGHGKGEVLGLAWSPNGNFIASAGADQTVQISNGVNGTPILPFFTDHRDLRQVNAVRAVDWSPSGNDIVSGDSEGKVLVWHTVERKTFLIYRGHKKAVNVVAWSPDGKRVASASTDKTAQVWDATTGKTILIYKGHTDAVNSVAWSPDGKRIASASDDKTVQVWDATTGEHSFTYHGHTNKVQSVAWSPDGKRIASASYDATVRVWRAI